MITILTCISHKVINCNYSNGPWLPLITFLLGEVVIPRNQFDSGSTVGKATQLIVLDATVHGNNGDSTTRVNYLRLLQ